MLVAGVSFAVLATALNGLEWGVGDHGIVAAFIGAPLPGDLLEHAREHHPSLLWPLLSWIPAPLGWHALHLASLAAVGAALFALGQRLMPDSRLGPWVPLLLLAPGHIALGGAPTFESLLVPRGVALPLEVLAVVLALDRRWLGAWVLVGLAVNVHAPSGVALGAGLLVAWWPDRERWWTPGVSVLVALPVLIWGGAAVGRVAMDSVWLHLVEARLAHHLDPGSWRLTAWGEAAGWLVLAGFGLRNAPSTLRRLGLGLLLWMLGAGLLGWAFAVPVLMNLEPWQVGRFLVIGGALGLVVPMMELTGLRRMAAPVVLGLVVVGASLAGMGDRGGRARWQPGGPVGDVRALADWAQRHSGATDLFVVPPDLNTFRPLARRPVFGTFQDGGELQFDRRIAIQWARRMETLCGCEPFTDPLPPETRTGDRRRALQETVTDGYESLDPTVLGEIAQAAGASWIVRRVGAIPERVGGEQAVARFGVLAVYPVGKPPSQHPDR